MNSVSYRWESMCSEIHRECDKTQLFKYRIKEINLDTSMVVKTGTLLYDRTE